MTLHCTWLTLDTSLVPPLSGQGGAGGGPGRPPRGAPRRGKFWNIRVVEWPQLASEAHFGMSQTWVRAYLRLEKGGGMCLDEIFCWYHPSLSFSSYAQLIISWHQSGIIGRIFPAHGNNRWSSGGYFLRKFQVSSVKGQLCTMESHFIHSNAVFRLKGP